MSDIILFANILFIVVLRLQLPLGVRNLHLALQLLVLVIETPCLLLQLLEPAIQLLVVILPLLRLPLQVLLDFLVFLELDIVVVVVSSELLGEAEELEDRLPELFGDAGGDGSEGLLFEIDFSL